MQLIKTNDNKEPSEMIIKIDFSKLKTTLTETYKKDIVE